MNLEEALLVLELPAIPVEQQARRAYLRQVKRFKPDHDPVQFRRIREAYETLQAHYAITASLRAELEPAMMKEAPPPGIGIEAAGAAESSSSLVEPPTSGMALACTSTAAHGTTSVDEAAGVEVRSPDGFLGSPEHDTDQDDVEQLCDDDLHQLLATGDYLGAAERCRDLLVSDMVPDWELDLTYRLVLQLEGLGRSDRAAELLEALTGYLERHDLEPDFLRDRAGWRAALLGEVNIERKYLSKRIWKLLALTAAGFDESPEANFKLTLVAGQELTWRERDAFHARSPNLGAILRAAEGGAPTSSRSPAFTLFLSLAFAAYWAIRMTGSCDEETPKAEPRQGVSSAAILQNRTPTQR